MGFHLYISPNFLEEMKDKMIRHFGKIRSECVGLFNYLKELKTFPKEVGKNNFKQLNSEIIIFHHIPKAAGTSLRSILKKNYKSGRLLEPYGPGRESVAWYREYFQSLDYKQKQRLKCISAHTANFIIPVFLELRQRFKAFCLLRDPVERVISLFYFSQSISETGKGRGAMAGKAIRRLKWNIEDIFLNLGEGGEKSSDLHEIFKDFFNGQVRILLAPHISTGDLLYTSKNTNESVYENKLHEILNNYYIIGLQEYYNRSVEYFSREFGWKHLVYNKDNITKSRPKVSELPDDVVSLIRAHNQLDINLHGNIKKRFDG